LNINNEIGTNSFAQESENKIDNPYHNMDQQVKIEENKGEEERKDENRRK